MEMERKEKKVRESRGGCLIDMNVCASSPLILFAAINDEVKRQVNTLNKIKKL